MKNNHPGTVNNLSCLYFTIHLIKHLYSPLYKVVLNLVYSFIKLCAKQI